ncbi:hypothetical protein J6O48_01555 [bacterium]|nr:hypothetical protein [bacterium]
MKDLLKYIRPAFSRDAISDCANGLKDLKKLKMTYPPEEKMTEAIFINLKA